MTTDCVDSSESKSVILFELVGFSSDLPFDQYFRLLRYPVWGLVTETLRYTRSYEDGLRAANKLLELTEKYRTQMVQEQYSSNLKALLFLTLDMLDRLDRWDDYLKLWTELRARTDLLSICNNVSTLRRLYGHALDEWVVSEDSSGLHLHFLWGTNRRKQLIEKKLHKQETGGKLGNMRHARHEDLSDNDIRERYEFMLRKAEYVQKIDALIKSVAGIK